MSEFPGGRRPDDFFASPTAPTSPTAPAQPAFAAPARPRAGVPEIVAVAYTLLAVFAALGLYLAISIVSWTSQLSDLGGDSGGNGLAEFCYGGSGVLGLALVYFLRAGAPAARLVAAALASCWGVYWLYELVRFSGEVGGLSGAFGAVGAIGTLGGLLVVASSFAIPALLWTPSATEHFASR